MPAYFASDVHLRHDRPERARRFARWVEGLEGGDSLTIVGDLCDFWFAARERHGGPSPCAGLAALAAFRARGGTLTVLPGNHDESLGTFYEQSLGARFVREPLRVEAFGLRLLIVHGHRLGGRRPWKEAMESPVFLEAFRRTPSPVATLLDGMLERSNERRRLADDARHLAVYRRFAAAQGRDTDLVVLGHIHQTVDETEAVPRMIVLGGWHTRSSFLKIDASGAALIVMPDPSPISC